MFDLQGELPMKMVAMEGWLNMTKSMGDDVFVPMAITKESADGTEEESRSYRLAGRGVPVCHGGDSFMFSLVI